MHKIIKITIGLCLLIGMAWGQMAMAGNSAKQIAEWRQQAEQGDAAAHYKLGTAYLLGEGVAEDKAEWKRRHRLA